MQCMIKRQNALNYTLSLKCKCKRNHTQIYIRKITRYCQQNQFKLQHYLCIQAPSLLSAQTQNQYTVSKHIRQAHRRNAYSRLEFACFSYRYTKLNTIKMHSFVHIYDTHIIIIIIINASRNSSRKPPPALLPLSAIKR